MIKTREEDRHDERMTLAWFIAALSNQPKLPKLDTLLTKKKRRTPTIHEQVAVLHKLSAHYGIPLRKAKKKTSPQVKHV